MFTVIMVIITLSLTAGSFWLIERIWKDDWSI